MLQLVFFKKKKLLTGCTLGCDLAEPVIRPVYTIKAVMRKCPINNNIWCSLSRCDVTQAFCERNLNHFTEQIEGQIVT